MSWNEEIQLYKELLEILQVESQALARTDEEALLRLAAAKEEILQRLLALPLPRRGVRQTAKFRARPRHASGRGLPPPINGTMSSSPPPWKVIQDFLAQFTPPRPGTYRPAGPAAASPGEALFSRQV